MFGTVNQSFNGHTLTSRIKLMDVLSAIKEHAFMTSEYPVIPSLEVHCSYPQQLVLAENFIDTFQEMLFAPSEDELETMKIFPSRIEKLYSREKPGKELLKKSLKKTIINF